MRLCIRIWLGLLGSFCVAFAAQAVPIQWTLNGVTFTDGGTASGTFVYDAATNTYSNINITTTAGSTVTTGATFQFVCTSPCTGVSASPTQVLFLSAAPSGDLTGARGLALWFVAPLTDAGGGHDLASNSMEASCSNAVCQGNEPPQRQADSGTVQGAPVPPPAEPSPVPTLGEWGLLALVLAMLSLGWRQRRLSPRV